MSSVNRQHLFETVAGMAEEIVDFAHALVAVPTENPPGNAYPACVALIESRLRDLGLPVESVRLSGGRTAVLSGVGSGPTLFLHGHYDVVPSSRPGQFAPRVEGDRLWGRGSADMKGGIAAMSAALAAIAAVDLPGRVELVLVPDEETGGEHGSARLHELGHLGRAGSGAVLAEPTSGRIWNASRGAVTLRVNVHGISSHVGLQVRGVNAFERAVPILVALQELKREVEERRTDHTIDPEEAGASILMLGGEVTGGHQFNLVPDLFSFTVERRVNPEEEVNAERDRLLRVIRSSAPDGLEVEIEVIQEGGASATPADGGLVGALNEAIESVTGRAAPCELCPGLLETRFYTGAGVPAVAYGPGELEVAHGPDESVSLDRLTECAQIYALTAATLFGR